MTEVFVLLGSNMGDKLENLNRAKALICERLGVLQSESSIYQTAPWGFESDEEFLNQVLIVKSAVLPFDFLKALLEIETQLGRVRNANALGYQSRSIDLDILFYGNQCLSNDELTVPHPRIAERRFVLEPLVELEPNFVHPVLNIKLEEMLRVCKDSEMVKKINN